jgi:hypothetical protein
MKKIALLLLIGLLSLSAEEKIDFNRQIRPILSDKCFFCHGPDATEIKGKLQLHSLEHATKKLGKKKNRQALFPGDLKKSEIWARIMTDDEDDIMPPADSHKTLDSAEKGLLKKWIEQGGTYDKHWAYKEIPATASLNIDQLIEKSLAKKDLKLNPQAPKRTLIRRLSYDLRGLPPTQKEITTFLSDKSPQAWEKQVDTFLNDSHYGERMAVFWLDLVRFADTIGYHSDANQRVYPYRDYVIRSFNDNKKYDLFVRQQLAGDQMAEKSDDNLIGATYNRLSMMTEEGGAQPKEYLAKYGADRVRTFGTVFLGSTTGCCECHDHKYDPFSAKDFYSLKAFFEDIEQRGHYRNPHHPLGKVKDAENFPKYEKNSARQKEIDISLKNMVTKANNDPAYKKWAESMNFDGKNLTAKSKSGRKITLRADRSILVTGKAADKDNYEIDLELSKSTKNIVLEVLVDKSLKSGFNTANGNFILTYVEIFDASGKALKIVDAKVDFSQKGHNIKNTLKKDNLGWAAEGYRKNRRQNRVVSYKLEKAIKGKISVKLSFESIHKQHTFDCFRISGFQDMDIKSLSNLIKGNDLTSAWLTKHKKSYQTLTNEKITLVKAAKSLNNGMADYLLTKTVKPAVTRILPRGNWMDDSGEIVQPAIPEFLGKLKVKGRANRLDLANWVTSKENPLTSRVFANRVWKILFGKGLSEVVEDVGSQGQTPYYTAVLDSLADGFHKDWDIKKLIKRIAMSKTYKQQSDISAAIAKSDPFNLLLSHQNSKRLDAEFVRDGSLAASGLLNRKMYGKSIKPYQPVGHYSQLNFPKRKYYADMNANQYRRGVYMHWQRTFIHPMLQAFDAPTREESCARRSISNTPLQALVLLNDPTFVEAAKALATNALKAKVSTGETINSMFEKVTGRLPSAKEHSTLSQFLESQKALYKAEPKKATELLSIGMFKEQYNNPETAAWTSLARIILNLHESVTVY